MHLILASNRVECCPERFQMQAATAIGAGLGAAAAGTLVVAGAAAAAPFVVPLAVAAGAFSFIKSRLS